METVQAQELPAIATFGAKDNTWGVSRHPVVVSGLKNKSDKRKLEFLTISVCSKNVFVRFWGYPHDVHFRMCGGEIY